jgi:hypothetical protein
VEAAGPIALLCLLLVLYHPLVSGQFPWQADHTVHQAKAWLLAEQLLPSGRVTGWTHQSGTGYPAEVLYPPLGDLWMAAVRFVTFKQLSWHATYALGLFGVIAFGVLGFYYLGRRLFGPLAGLLAGCFVLTDLGGFREGGYVFTLQYGVWPLHLGIVLGFLGLLALHDLLSAPGWRHLGRAGVALCAALLCHPVTLIFFLVALPLYGIFSLWRSRPEPLLGKGLAAIGLGLGLAAFWLLPFLVKAPGFSAHVSNHWKALPDIAGGLLGADLWQGAWAWPAVMGGLGAILAVKERRPLAGYLVALAAALLLAASLTVYTELRLSDWLASARFVQFQRFVIFVKLIAFLLAGFLAQRIFVGISRGALAAKPEEDEPAASPPSRAPSPAPEADADANSGAASLAAAQARARPLEPFWRGLRLGVVALLAAPFVLPLGIRLVEDRLLPVSGLSTMAEKGPFVSDFKAVLQHVCAEVRRPGAPFSRVAFLSGFNDHEMANAALYCPHPEVKLSFIPSETFKYRANLSPAEVPRTLEDLRALNVRFVVGNSTQAAPPWLRLVMRRGRVTLHDVPDYKSEPFTVLRRVGGGAGEAERFEALPPGSLDVKVTHFGDEEIRIRAGVVPPDHFLLLHVAHFASWRAKRGQVALDIRAHDATPRVRGLMLVPLGEGTTLFEYRRQAVDWLGWALTLLSLALVLLLAALRLRPALAGALSARLQPDLGLWTARLRRPARLLFLFACGLAAAFLLVSALGKGAPPDRPRSLAQELGSARVSMVSASGKRARCRIFQMGRWICGKGRRYVGPVAEEWNLKNRFGLWAHPDESGALEIEFPAQRLGRALEIDYGILQSGGLGAPVTLGVSLDGEAVGEVSWPRQRGPAGWAPEPLVIDTSARQGQRASLRFTVTTTHIGGRHFAFDPKILP